MPRAISSSLWWSSQTRLALPLETLLFKYWTVDVMAIWSQRERMGEGTRWAVAPGMNPENQSRWTEEIRSEIRGVKPM